jgi:hypothetical protein
LNPESSCARENGLDQVNPEGELKIPLLRKRFFIFLIMSPAFQSVLAGSAGNQVQDDPVLVYEAATPPVIDGIGDDACWQSAAWQSIDQVWIPYGGTVSPDDYSGRYKVVWSQRTNLLYFLVDVTDDVFVGGYIPGVTADIYNYDISEVFIDEDKSGGEHRYDGNGTNAENAFAYHMYADFPKEGQVTKVCHVDDMAGTASNSRRADYSSHFPEFALRTAGHTAVREFSLIVYNDAYSDDNKDAARVQLTVGKEMGLSVAYCDNDNPNENPKVRDNMFGSVWEPSPGNLHWMNADYFGTAKLVSGSSGVIMNDLSPNPRLKLYPNPASSQFQLQMDVENRGDVSIRVFNLLGQNGLHAVSSKNDNRFIQTFILGDLPRGLYFVEAIIGDQVARQKLIIDR